MEAAAEPAGNIHVPGLMMLMKTSTALLVSQVSGPHHISSPAAGTRLQAHPFPWLRSPAQQLYLINKLLISYPGSRSGREATATKLQETRAKCQRITLRI